MTRTELVKLEEVEHVYNGKQGKCCCGCSGNHWYPSTATKEEVQKSRGYQLGDDEVSDAGVKFVLRKVNVAIAEGKVEDGKCYLAANTPTRVYIVYLKETV